MDDDFPPVHCLEPVCQPSALHVGPASAAFSIQLLNNEQHVSAFHPLSASQHCTICGLLTLAVKHARHALGAAEQIVCSCTFSCVCTQQHMHMLQVSLHKH